MTERRKADLNLTIMQLIQCQRRRRDVRLRAFEQEGS